MCVLTFALGNGGSSGERDKDGDEDENLVEDLHGEVDNGALIPASGAFFGPLPLSLRRRHEAEQRMRGGQVALALTSAGSVCLHVRLLHTSHRTDLVDDLYTKFALRSSHIDCAPYLREVPRAHLTQDDNHIEYMDPADTMAGNAVTKTSADTTSHDSGLRGIV
ncbi:hypothetical protein ONZ51_g3692 [Trametes cubensis]|uniref:Uncharacterized protein n=1 Tax=Trametes cubensis TaxID=1111947 RepID=A0AAD7XD80_9APHY|nr:hypothetical protein ONZ51_g3692 [Trametes cubensis]